jgi:hypothetical protein
VTQDTSIGQGPHCPAIFLNVGDNKTVATPSCDAGIVWTITLEGVD